MLKKNKKFIGLDIGSTALKMAVLKPGKEGLALESLGAQPLDSTVIVDGSIMDAAGLEAAITNLLLAHDLPLKADIATALGARSAVIRVVEMDLMSDDDITTTLEMEAESYIASDITGLFVDHQVLETFEVEGVEKMRVLVVAAKQDQIDEFSYALKSIGLNPAVVDLDCFAAINVVTHNYDISEDVAALIHVGHNSTTVSIVQNGIFLFSRAIATGGHVFIQNLLKNLSIDEQAATEILAGRTPEGVEESEIATTIDDVADSVAQEIRRSFDFFEATNDEVDISKIFVTGGMTQQDVLLKAISEKIDKPVERVDPFKNIEIDESDFDLEYVNDIASTMVVAVGLALRGMKS